MAVTEVTAVYRADTTAFVRGTKQAQAAAQQFSNAMGQADLAAARTKASTIALGSAAALVATQALTKATAKVKEFAMQGVQAAASYEQTVISIEGIFVGMGMTVGQATEQTKTYLADLRDFAATTPFELPQTLDAVKRLLSIGYAAEDVKDRLLPAIGDITSALGQPASSINAVVYAMGQIKSAGRVMAQDLMQIGNALPGFNARMAIAKELFNGDMAAMAEAVESGSLTGEKAIEALISQMQKFPGAAGAMERQSKTLNGVISTFKDTVNNALIDALMPAMPVLSEALMNLVDPVSQLAVAFASQLGPIMIQVANSATEFAPQFSELASAIMDLAGGAVVRLVQVMGELAPLISAAAKVVGTLAEVLMNLPGPVLAAMAALLIMMKTSLGMAFIKAIGAATIGVTRFATTTTTSAATASTGFAAIGASAVASMRVTDAAMKAGTVAVNGFKAALSSTGVGLIIVGIATALTAMAMSSDEASQAASTLTDSILDQNGALVENHRQLIAKSLAEQGVLDAATKAGIATSDLIDAYAAGGNALQPYIDRMNEFAEANRDSEEGLKLIPDWLWDNSSAYGETAGAVKTAADALQAHVGVLDQEIATLNAATIAAEGTAGAYANNAAQTGNMSMASIRAAQAADLYTPSAQTAAAATDDLAAAAAEAEAALAAMRAENEKWLAVTGQISAVDAAATAIEGLGAASVEFGTNLMGQTPNARKFRGEVIGAFEASARAAAELGTSVEEQRAIFTGELVKIVASLRASGVKDRDIQQFLGAMDDLPASVEQIMTASGAAMGKGAKRFKTDVQKQIEQAFGGGVKAARPLNEQAMDAMAQSATDKAKAKLGLTLEPQLASVIKAASSGLAATAKSEGEAPGYNLSAGMANGVTRGSPLVQDAVRRVIAAAKAAADAASQSQSPSRLFMEVGDNLIQGLRIGWVKGNKAFTDQIARTVQDAWWSMQDAKDAVQDAKKALSDVRAEQAKGEASARDVAAAERALAKAYRDSADAAKAYAEAQRTIKAFQKLSTVPVSPNAIRQFIGFDETGMDSLQIAETIVQNMEKGFDDARRRLILRATRAGMSRAAAEAYADSVMETFGRAIEERQRLLGEAMERLAKVREQIQKLEAEQEERTGAGKTIARFITDRFGQPSEFKRAYDATSVTIDQAISLFDQYEELIRRRFTGLDKAAGDALVAQFEQSTAQLVKLIAERDEINKRLDDSRKKLIELQTQRADAEKKIADSLRGFFKPTGKIGSADEYIMGLNQRVAATRQFIADIATLRKRGVAGGTIEQILEMGVESGASFAAALAGASDAQLSQINSLNATAETLATQFGSNQASIMYDAGVKAQDSLVKGIEAELKTKEGQIQAVVNQIGAMFAGLTDSNLVAGEAAAQALLAGLKTQEDEILTYIRTLSTQIRDMLIAAMQPPTAPPPPGRGGGGGGRGRNRSAMVPTAPVIPYSTAPAITVASGGVQVAVTVGSDQNPAAASDTVKMAVMEALSEVAARAANARR